MKNLASHISRLFASVIPLPYAIEAQGQTFVTGPMTGTPVPGPYYHTNIIKIEAHTILITNSTPAYYIAFLIAGLLLYL